MGDNIGLPNAIYQDVSALSTEAKHVLGDILYTKKGMYVYAYNAANSNLNKGLNVVFDTGATNWSMIVSGGTGVAYFGLVEEATVPTANYFWLLRKGHAVNIILSGNSAAPGVSLYPAVGGGLSKTLPTGLSTAGIDHGVMACGWVKASMTTDASAQSAFYKAFGA